MSLEEKSFIHLQWQSNIEYRSFKLFFFYLYFLLTNWKFCLFVLSQPSEHFCEFISDIKMSSNWRGKFSLETRAGQYIEFLKYIATFSFGNHKMSKCVYININIHLLAYPSICCYLILIRLPSLLITSPTNSPPHCCKVLSSKQLCRYILRAP